MGTHLITGGAGFIPVNLARRLLADGHRVVAVDDLSRGKLANLAPLVDHPAFSFVQADCSDADALGTIIASAAPVSDVWHMAANSDIPAGVADPAIDLHRTFMTTFGTLAAMRRHAVPRLHFASSSAIYGDFGDVEIHEDIGPLQPISNYGAMKLASEAQIRAAVESYLERANIFRFPNVIGVPATHGVILDFVGIMKASPNELTVLGNGTQQKSYMHVNDLVDAMLFIAAMDGRYRVFNIGASDDGVSVRSIAEGVRDRMNPQATIAYGEGPRGWVGDVPRVYYSTRRLADAGWQPKIGSAEAVRRAIDEIVIQECGD